MRVAIIGSRNITQDDYDKILPHIPADTTEIVSGGAQGVDELAERYAHEHNLRLTVFKPEYEKYGKRATHKRNVQIVEYSDQVFAFWDGFSKGTAHVIVSCIDIRTPVKVVLIKSEH